MTTNKKFMYDINIIGSDDFICYNVHDGITSFNHDDIIDYMKFEGVLSKDYRFNNSAYIDSLIYLLNCFDELDDDDNKYVFINNYNNIQKLLKLVIDYEN